MKSKRLPGASPEFCCTDEKMQLIQSHPGDICKTRQPPVTSVSRTVPAAVTRWETLP